MTVRPAARSGGAYAFSVGLDQHALAVTDIQALLAVLLDRVPQARPHRTRLLLILAELFNNALDHGILKLDSALKSQADGLARYLAARARGLHELGPALIRISVELVEAGNIPTVRITMADSGPGFAHAAVLASPAAGADRAYGRGIALVTGLCHSIEYRGNGNEVSVLYHLASAPR